MDDLADANKTIEVLKGLQNQGQTINYVDNRVNRVENIQQNITIYGSEKLPDAKRMYTHNISDDTTNLCILYTEFSVLLAECMMHFKM